MGYNCAISVADVSRGTHHEFLAGLERDGVLDDVRSVSFTETERLHIVEYDGAEFLARYGAFPPADRSDERLWILFEFETDTDADRLCDLEGFRFLARKLPRLEALRSEIVDVTGRDTGGGIYGSEGAYDPWGFDSRVATDSTGRDDRRG